MTVESYSSLPFAAGGALAGAAYRSALAGVAVFMRQPLRNSATVGLIGLCVLAGGNALYRQHHHPAPLFGSFEDNSTPSASRPVKDARAVLPIDRPNKLAVDSTETTGTIAPQPAIPAPTVIGHDDVVAMQKKLIALNLFSGTADGLFGAKTSAAIRAFEQSLGRPAKGMLTPQVMALIAAAPLPQQVPPVPVLLAAKPTPQIAAVPPTVAAGAPKPLIPLETLPAPSPLTAAKVDMVPPAALPIPASPSLLAASNVQQDASLTPSQTGTLPPVAKRTVQTIAVHAEPAQPLPAQLAPPEDSDQATTDPDTVASVQRGLNSLGFLRGNVNGIADEATAKAVRNFEVFYNYDVTGRVTRELVNLLKLNGATV